MRVTALADGLKSGRLRRIGDDPDIRDVTNDSRRVTSGSLYAALPGSRVDGHDFIPDAIAAGAVAVLCERIPDSADSRIAWITADSARLALSEISDRFFGSPSSAFDVIGVTGTDGKTTTVSFTHQVLTALDASASFLSTAALLIAGDEQPNMLHQSTPEAPEVHRTLARMREAGSRFAVLESTSHGLSRRTCRLAHVRYRTGVFTNLSHEHLEFHGSFAQYRSDKANLFRALNSGCYADASQEPPEQADPPPSFDDRAFQAAALLRAKGTIDGAFGVICADDANAPWFAAATDATLLSYSTEPGRPAAFSAESIDLSPTGTSFRLVTPVGAAPCRLSIPGRFNVANALAAAAVAQGLLGASPEALAEAIGSLRSVRGRMSVIQNDPFAVVVDYAHTPGSFEHVLPFFREQTRNRLIVVFGSAGERDVAKRPLQGRIASRYADLIVLTDEDPRSEDRVSILREIAAGCPDRREGDDILLIPDRRDAIRVAFDKARPGDTVLLLGKGHEATIIGAHETVPWNEEQVARELLANP